MSRALAEMRSMAAITCSPPRFWSAVSCETSWVMRFICSTACTICPLPSACCTDENRQAVGNIREVDGFKFCYKICRTCGHAVRYFYPAVKTNDKAVREYRAWKRYMVQ